MPSPFPRLQDIPDPYAVLLDGRIHALYLPQTRWQTLTRFRGSIYHAADAALVYLKTHKVGMGVVAVQAWRSAAQRPVPLREVFTPEVRLAVRIALLPPFPCTCESEVPQVHSVARVHEVDCVAQGRVVVPLEFACTCVCDLSEDHMLWCKVKLPQMNGQPGDDMIWKQEVEQRQQQRLELRQQLRQQAPEPATPSTTSSTSLAVPHVVSASNGHREQPPLQTSAQVPAGGFEDPPWGLDPKGGF